MPADDPQHTPRRRLAAILAADVVGYSRMMQADEPGRWLPLRPGVMNSSSH
jgi:class 3 adenylate cyclase